MKLADKIRQMNDDELAEYLTTVIQSCINGELEGIIEVCKGQIKQNRITKDLITLIKESLGKEADNDGSD